jgi:hypothetical protein
MTERAARGRGVALVLAAAAWLAALAVLRFGFMEIPAEDDPCLAAPEGAACRLRAGIGLAIHLHVLGSAALVAALAAHLRLGAARDALALLGLFAALLALMLYNPARGAPAAVIALLALADRGLLPRWP